MSFWIDFVGNDEVQGWIDGVLDLWSDGLMEQLSSGVFELWNVEILES
jgi:hypothetical protein